MINNHSLLESIRNSLSESLGTTSEIKWVRDLNGGDINRAALLRQGKTDWFLKYHDNAPDDMFAAEAQALREISDQGCIKAPAPVSHGRDRGTDWLLMEYLELTSNGPASLLGEQLAALHHVTASSHGWNRNNYIGSTPQDNTRSDDWAVFFRDCRLKPQLELAQAAGHGLRLSGKGDHLLESILFFMQDHQPAASLLHGDLWSGNKAFTPDGQPVIFDPASYYGDRETDIAMTELFGGFDRSFYSAYQAHYPLPDGYRLRRDLYNLYHMLNHLNLFGAAYLSRCEHMIDQLMAQVR